MASPPSFGSDQRHAPGSALHLLSIFGSANVFRTQRAAFERCDAVNALLSPHFGATSTTTAATNNTETPPAVRRHRKEVERKHSLIDRGRHTVLCVESNEVLVQPYAHTGNGQEESPQQHHQQTRFFVVASSAALCQYVAEVPPERQHMYEIIRDGEPCFFYLDVECDVASTPDDITVDPLATSVPAKMLRDARACPLDCQCRVFDGEGTCAMLLRELREFLLGTVGLVVRPEDIVVLRSRGTTKFSQHYIVRPASNDPHEEERFLFLNNAYVGLLVAAFVHSLYGRARDDGAIHRHLFFHAARSPTDVISMDQPLDNSGENLPADSATLRSVVEIPVLPLKCVIDEAVYSRNRMFRCLGSRKLGKVGALDLEAAAPATQQTPPCVGAGSMLPGGILFAWLRHSLVSPASVGLDSSLFDASRFVASDACEAAFHAVMAGVGGAAARAALRALSGVTRAQGDEGSSVSVREAAPHRGASNVTGARVSTRDFPKLTSALSRIMEDLVAASGTASIGSVAFATAVLASAGNGTLLVSVGGRRYCPSIRRQHKSNGVYFVVRPSSRDVVLKCHDPECHGRQSEPMALLPEVWNEVGLFHTGGGGSQLPAVTSGPRGASLAPTPATLEEANQAARDAYRRSCTRFVPKVDQREPSADGAPA
jgi:hypothetical protein